MQEKETTATENQNRPDGGFTMKIGRTTFEIGLHFSKTSEETLDDKVKSLIRQDIKAGNF
ncbi:MAG: transposon-encoded TnpW family protein [Clostridiales bacterium]|nr:transposon-encoded TnpW family protein [Clostridiales bacterium]